MSKSIRKIANFGEPVWVITENLLTNRVKVAGEFGHLSALTYFAADAIFIKKIEYDEAFPGDLTKVVYNRGMKSEVDETKSLELHVDLSKEERNMNATSVFTDEESAQLVAKKMNENQKANCKKIFDAVAMAYNSYDEIIAACKVTR